MSKINYLCKDNGVEIHTASSNAAGCPAENLLVHHDYQLWLSDAGLPQAIVLDLTNMQTRMTRALFGWRCWHNYSSNPKEVTLFSAGENLQFIEIGRFEGVMDSGDQLFSIELDQDVQYLKVIIESSFGAQKVYINELLLYEDESRLLQAPPKLDYSATYSDIISEPIRTQTDSYFSATPIPTTQPKVSFSPQNEAQKLQQKINQLTETLGGLRDQITHLAEEIETLDEDADLDELYKFKRDLVKEIHSSSHNKSASQTSWETKMNSWQEKVLFPMLDQFSKNLEQKILNAVSQPQASLPPRSSNSYYRDYQQIQYVQITM